uniref:RNA-directed DNA polymerase n=1 Tax=Trichuris muris TaxID=70415 RepID=A0A5S6QV55_TRIMR
MVAAKRLITGFPCFRGFRHPNWQGRHDSDRALLDSGSSVSLICRDALRDHGNDLSSSSVTLMTASGQSLTALGSTVLNVQIGSLNCSQNFLVMHQLVTDVILGTDFLAAHQVCIDVARRIAFGPKLGRLCLGNSTSQRMSESRLACVRSVPNPDEEEDTLASNAIPFTNGRPSEYDLPTCPQQYADTVRRFAHVFTTIPGTTTLAEHKIWTRGPQLKSLHAASQNAIKPSNSPWMAPAVYTLKPSGEVRICVDYRELNKRTRKDAYPLPLPDDVFDRITDAKIFSTLDMQSGFWQIPVSPQDMDKTAFSPGPGMGLYQFKRMPFGLTGAPSTFQRMMDTILNGLDFVAVYLDDIIIFSPDHRTHALHLQAVLQKLADAGLTLRGSKCRIGVTAVQYLGHVFSANGIAPNPSKVAVIESWPVPSDKKALKRFLGLTSYYRRFVAGYATISEPLYNLLREGTTFQWTNTCQIAFDDLKKRLTTAPFLTPPNFHRPFELMTDASDTGLGAVLEQQGRVVAFASRSLKRSERNYSAIEKECLGIVFALKSFRHYLLGRPFTIFTDHAPLQWLAAQKMEGRLARWALAIQEYDYVIKYRPGHINANADALSRIEDTCAATSVTSEISMETLRLEQQRDPMLRAIKEALDGNIPLTSRSGIPRRLRQVRRQLNVADGIVVRTLQPRYARETIRVVVVPSRLRHHFLRAAHNVRAAGHLGVSKTLAKLAAMAYWPGMSKDVENYCKSCTDCQRTKLPLTPPVPLQPSSPVGRPWERIGVDVLEVPMSLQGHKYLLVVQDYFTKWLEAIPLKNQTTATIARELTALFCRMGIPAVLHSDQGANFESDLLHHVLRSFGVKKTRTTPYHPQSDGLVERANRSLLQMFRTYVRNDSDWEEHLPLLLYAYRTATHASTGNTPFALMFGRRPKALPIVPVLQSPWHYSVNNWSTSLQETMLRLQAFAQKHQTAASEQQRYHYDFRAACRPEFAPGTQVWLWFPRRSKLQPQWQEGWSVVEMLSPTTAKVRRDNGTHKIVHVNRLQPRTIRTPTEVEMHTEDLIEDNAPESSEPPGEVTKQRRNPDRQRRPPPRFRDYIFSSSGRAFPGEGGICSTIYSG